MQLKDYYATLEIAPVATELQIKKSFRQLALRHHPDKNPGSAIAEAKFREIQEAYEILSDPGKREEYNYKRWYNKSLKKQYSNEPLTAAAILTECDRLYNYMLTVNVFRVDYDGLSYHIRQLISDTNISILKQSGDAMLIKKVIEKLLAAASALPTKYIGPVQQLLLQLAGNDESLTNQINLFVQQHKQKSYWQKYQVATVVIITVLICLMIYTFSR